MTMPRRGVKPPLFSWKVPLLAAALLVLVVLGALAEDPVPGKGDGGAAMAGSRSCRECHERFYELWAPSHHGTAMQPWSPALDLPPTEAPVRVGDRTFDYRVREGRGLVVERQEAKGSEGAPGEGAAWPVEHVMGGKNVFFLLTPRERGRLQVLPIAWDVVAREWYDTTGSMVRHAAADDDQPVDWEDPLLTFNTACWSCHVSQLQVNYDLATDTYDSRWAEPGINCETCHGPAAEHVRVCREAPEGTVPEDLKILRMGTLTPEQLNDACASCHAKAIPLTDAFSSGEGFFDHFDLVTLESPDFYPDGRDLGENYTFTLWRMSPCVTKGGLDCIHCHTSSGRYRFHGDNGACLPCHADHVEDAAAHTHHAADGEASLCVSCHMPMTTFARMRRSDHSMLPPAPAVSQAHGSPNACNLCHADEDAAWADRHVRAWRERDYQAPMLAEAALVAKARAGDWSDLPAMLDAVAAPQRGEVLRTSLIRLLGAAPDRRKVPVLVGALDDDSPLVRGAAAATLEPHVREPAVAVALVRALDDARRLVRIRAAASLAGLSPGDLAPETRRALERATGEWIASLLARPDQWNAHFNLGNLHERRGDADRALEAYATAARLRPDVAAPLVNAAMVHARQGRLNDAERLLREALAVDPDGAEAHYDLGLLLAETGRRAAAKTHLETAFTADPRLVRAALNRAVIAAEEDDLAGAIAWSRKAVAADAGDADAAWAHATYLALAKRPADAIRVLERALSADAASFGVYDLLGRLHLERGDAAAARRTWTRARDDARLDAAARRAFAARVR